MHILNSVLKKNFKCFFCLAEINSHLKNRTSENKFDLRSLGIVLLIWIAGFLARLLWVFLVQSPDTAIFSDMRSYMWRAVYLLLDQQEISKDRQLDMVLFPYGVHYLYALELWIFGHANPELAETAKYYFVGSNFVGMSILQALISSLAVVFTILTARHCFKTMTGPIIIGVICAFWQPQISYTGFFLSETPFSFFISLSFWLFVRYIKTGKGSFVAGITAALGATIRPQILLTQLLCACWMVIGQRHLPFFRRHHVLLFLLPLAIVLGYSSVRYYHFTGEVGFISSNVAIGRFFASTSYESIRNNKGRRFTPPARSNNPLFEGTFMLNSHLADAKILDAERSRLQSILSIRKKIAMIKRNISMLVDDKLWPECNVASYAGMYAEWKKRKELDKSDSSQTEVEGKIQKAIAAAKKKVAKENRLRRKISTSWNKTVKFGLVPVALLGIGLLGFRRKLCLEAAALHVFTCIFTAAAFFGELRYRVPYDFVLILLFVYFLFVCIRLERTKFKQSGFVRYAILIALIVFFLLILVPW